MEKPRKKTERVKIAEKLKEINNPMLRKMALELQKDHSLTAKAISRILHVDIDFVEDILNRETLKEVTNAKE